MRRTWAIRVLALCAVLGLTVSAASADNGPTFFAARLTGFHETTSILTGGTGTFTLAVNGDTATYRLTYTGLTSPIIMSHIHFAQRGVNGNIVVWLCQTAAAPAPAAVAAITPQCVGPGETLTGTLSSANVLGVPAQNVTAGDFQGFLRILRAGDGYANIHTTSFTAGEIRGQVSFGFSDE